MRITVNDIDVRTSVSSDLPELTSFYDEACAFFKKDSRRPLMSPAVCMNEGDLPRGGRRENYELLTIRVGGTIIGYMSIYRDFPSKTIVWIPLIYIGSRVRGSGFGSRIIEGVCRYFYEAGYNSMRVAVSLRNFGAIRFWYSHRFDKIIDVSCDGYNVSEGGYGGIALEHRLR